MAGTIPNEAMLQAMRQQAEVEQARYVAQAQAQHAAAMRYRVELLYGQRAFRPEYFGGLGDLLYSQRTDYSDHYERLREAESRAETLLKENLSEQQLAEYGAERRFTVRGSDSGKTYRINYGTSINIDELDASGTKACSWCFQPQGAPSVGDTMLTQKIALECFESKALREANRFPVGGGLVGGGLVGGGVASLMQWGNEVTFAGDNQRYRVVNFVHDSAVLEPVESVQTSIVEPSREAQGLRNERISRGLWQRFRASPRGERQRRRRGA